MFKETERIVDAVFDIFYSNATPETKMHKLGVYLEHFLRMKFRIKDYFTLGDPRIKQECEKLYFKDEIFKNIEEIRERRNHASHTGNKTPITENDLQEVLECLEKIFVLFFCEYFQKHPFGSNLKIADSLSLLPPQSRVKILSVLYEDKNIKSKKICLLDKLCLAILKAQGLDCAKQWIEKNKNELQSIKECVEIDEISEEEKEPMKILAFIIEQNGRTMYDICLEKILLVNEEREKGSVPVYKNFEQAQKHYMTFDLREIIGNSPEALEFVELMDFVFLGRKEE